MAGFKGFGFQTSDDIIAERNAQFQQAMTSGNPHQMRAASVQQAAFTLFGDPSLHKARTTEEQIQKAFDTTKERKTGNDVADQIDFYREVQRNAVDAGLPEVAMQATEKLTMLQAASEERDRLFSQESRLDRQDQRAENADDRAANADKRADELHDISVQKGKEEEVTRRLNRRRDVHRTMAEAYNASKQIGENEQVARARAMNAAVTYFAASTDKGTMAAGRKAAEEAGWNLDPESFDLETSASLGQVDLTEKLKSIVTVVGDDGQPQIGYFSDTPQGPKFTKIDEEDFDASLDLLGAEGESGTKTTDTQRQAVLFYKGAARANVEAETLYAFSDDHFGIEDKLQRMLPNGWQGTLAEYEQRVEATENAFIDNVLRPKSGATIKDEEYDRERKTYFPQAGDSKATVEFKRQLRQNIVASLYIRAKPALSEWDEATDQTSGEVRENIDIQKRLDEKAL